MKLLKRADKPPVPNGLTSSLEDGEKLIPDLKSLKKMSSQIPLPGEMSRRHAIKTAKFKRKRTPKPGRAKSLLNAGFILLMLGIIAFSVYQVGSHVTVGLNTLRTQEIRDESYVRLELYLFRDEQLITLEGSDTYLYDVPDGGRVGVGRPIGTAYAVGDAAAARALQPTLNAYGQRMALLRSMGGQGTPADARAAAEAFAALGVEEFGAVGETFDPNLHNAVMHVEDEEKGEGEIAEVHQKGYKKGERILRYAMVTVAN